LPTKKQQHGHGEFTRAWIKEKRAVRVCYATDRRNKNISGRRTHGSDIKSPDGAKAGLGYETAVERGRIEWGQKKNTRGGGMRIAGHCHQRKYRIHESGNKAYALLGRKSSCLDIVKKETCRSFLRRRYRLVEQGKWKEGGRDG